MVKATINQPEAYQGNLNSTKYVNKVTLSADGTMSVVATPVVKANLLPQATATPAATPSTANQILANTTIKQQTSTTTPRAATTDTSGYLTKTQPPGPPKNAS